MSIRMRILSSIVLSVFVAVACAAGIVYQQSRKDALEDFGGASREQLRLAGDYMALLMRDARGITQALSEMSIIRGAEGRLTRYMERAEPFSTDVSTLSDHEKAVCAVFSSYTRAFPAYAIIYMGTADGGFVEMPDLPMTPHFDSRERPWYQAAMASPDKTVMTEPYFSDTGELVYTLAHTVRNGENRIIGVVGIDITLKGLTDYLAAMPVGRGGQVVLTDEHGTVLYNLLDPSINLKNVAELNIPELRRMYDMGDGISEVSVRGEVYAAASHITPDGWHLMTFMPRAVLMRQAMDMLKIMVLAGAGLVAVLALFGLLLSRGIAAPINVLVDAAQGVAQGNFDAVPRDCAFGGELKRLHASMVSMVDQLRELLKTSQDKTREAEAALEQGRKALTEAEDAKRRAENARREGVAQTAERLDGIVVSLGDAGRQLGEQAGVINSSVENQLQRTRDTANAMNQMNEAVADVARNASDAAHVAEQAKEETQAGKRSVDDVVSGISEVERCSDEISASMAGLVRQVDDIGQVMNVISDIADQTNLLALNAAIEAARAGEAGRGFAVVADEVRKLAEKTMQATKSVGQAIQDIQRGAAESDRLIGKSVEYVRASTELAGKAGEALQRIEQMVLTTADQVRAIAAASEEQSATAEEVNRHTGDVSRIAEEVAHAMEVATASMGNLSSQVDALQRVMAELREDGRA